MIGGRLVIVFAALSLVAGNGFEIQSPQRLVSLPVSSEPSFFSGPIVSGNFLSGSAFPGSSVVPDGVFTSGTSGPVVSGNVFASTPSFVSQGSPLSVPLVSEPTFGNGLLTTTGSTFNVGTDLAPLQYVQAPGLNFQTGDRVIGQKCICTKTIVKPQVYQRTIVVPKFQNYIKRTVTPVVENIAYKTSPIAQSECAPSAVGSFPSSSQVFYPSGAETLPLSTPLAGSINAPITSFPSSSSSCPPNFFKF